MKFKSADLFLDILWIFSQIIFLKGDLILNNLKSIKKFKNWENKGIALITGASSGIGATFAKYLAQLNFNLILVARRKERMDALSKELREENSISIEILPADLSTEDGIVKVEKRINELNNLDILINNAGFGTVGTLLEADFS